MFFCGLVAHFFLLLNNIPCCGYTSLFIHSSIEGHHSCFQFLPIISKVAINIHRFMYGPIFSTHLGKYLEVQFLDPLVRLLSFVRSCHIVSPCGCFASLPAVYKKSHCFPSFSALAMVSILDFSLSNGCAVVSHYCFNL